MYGNVKKLIFIKLVTLWTFWLKLFIVYLLIIGRVCIIFAIIFNKADLCKSDRIEKVR